MASETSQKTTIADVARVAGVSVSTVSRVLNNEKYVRADKKKAVQDAVAKLQYQPNLYARSLAGDRSFLLGLIFDNVRGDYLFGMQRGAMVQCQKEGYHLVVEQYNRDSPAAFEQFLDRLQLSGVILTSPACDDPEILRIISERRIPCVRIAPSAPSEGMTSIVIDDYRAAYTMTNYLISLGHKEIGFIAGHPKHADAGERKRAFEAALADNGLSVNEDWIEEGLFTFESGLDCAVRILSQPKKPTAIFASNDEMAASVIAIADKLNIKVPDDLSVAGFDDLTLASFVCPPLTTIHQPVVEMAAAAVARLMEMRDNPQLDWREPVTLASKFILRKSTAAPRSAR
jgi:LacI family transcriptional regulator